MLRRGQILLIGGGAASVIGLSMLAYSSLGLVQALEDAEYTVEPNGFVEITQNITSTGQGAYFASFDGNGLVRPIISVTDPGGKLVLQKPIDQPVVVQLFSVIEIGEYVLNLTNPSPDSSIKVGVIVGSQESVLDRGGLLPQVAVTSTLLTVAGVVALVAGGIVIVIDRRRTSKMKQFGDMSDLV